MRRVQARRLPRRRRRAGGNVAGANGGKLNITGDSPLAFRTAKGSAVRHGMQSRPATHITVRTPSGQQIRGAWRRDYTPRLPNWSISYTMKVIILATPSWACKTLASARSSCWTRATHARRVVIATGSSQKARDVRRLTQPLRPSPAGRGGLGGKQGLDGERLRRN